MRCCQENAGPGPSWACARCSIRRAASGPERPESVWSRRRHGRSKRCSQGGSIAAGGASQPPARQSWRAQYESHQDGCANDLHSRTGPAMLRSKPRGLASSSCSFGGALTCARGGPWFPASPQRAGALPGQRTGSSRSALKPLGSQLPHHQLSAASGREGEPPGAVAAAPSGNRPALPARGRLPRRCPVITVPPEPAPGPGERRGAQGARCPLRDRPLTPEPRPPGPPARAASGSAP